MQELHAQTLTFDITGKAPVQCCNLQAHEYAGCRLPTVAAGWSPFGDDRFTNTAAFLIVKRSHGNPSCSPRMLAQEIKQPAAVNQLNRLVFGKVIRIRPIAACADQDALVGTFVEHGPV